MGFLVGFVLLDLYFYVYVCRSMFVLFVLAIVLSVLQFTASDYLPFLFSNSACKGNS